MSAQPTYVFHDLIRNLIVGRELYSQLEHKVDTRRLTHETSEDAVSWNVFVGILALNGISALFKLLTGRECENEPEVYLWGNHINGHTPKFWPRLRNVQREIDRGKRIPTEPDIILRAPGDAVVLVEAKFGSPNSLFEKKQKRVGSVADYLARYAPKQSTTDPLRREWIYKQKSGVLEQLCRNAIYADRLADEGEQRFLVNLVLANSEIDVVIRFQKHLMPKTVEFRRVAWEEIYALPEVHSSGANLFRKYFHTKTLKLRKAFAIQNVAPLRSG